MRFPRDTFLTALPLALLAACASPVAQAQPTLWKESPGPAAAPELARFNELLSQLADRMKPALVRPQSAKVPEQRKDDDGPRHDERHHEHLAGDRKAETPRRPAQRGDKKRDARDVAAYVAYAAARTGQPRSSRALARLVWAAAFPGATATAA